MRLLLLTSSLLVLLVSLATAGADGGGQTLDAQLREKLSPALREWVTVEAEKVRQAPKPDEAGVRADLQARFKGQSLSMADENRLAYLIFYDAVLAADRELNNYLAQLKANSGTAKPAPVATPPAGPSLQVGTSTPAPPPMIDRSGRLVAQPGPSPNGSTSFSPMGGGVTLAPSSAPAATPNVPAGALAVTPDQAQYFRAMNNGRNQLVLVINSLAKKVSLEPDSLLQQLK